VKTALLRADSQDRGRERFAPCVQPEGLLDRGDALAKREELGDVAAPKENRFPLAGRRAGGQEGFSGGRELLPESSPISRTWGAPSSRPIGPMNFRAARQIARGRVGAVIVISVT
jgi:hypothetical protein